jgi:DNA-binding GntR family transcriptional regulator
MTRRKSSLAADSAPAKETDQRIVGLSAAEERMFNAVIQAVAERRLAPGVKLVEEQLAEIFKLNRARIRKVLLILSQRRIVQLEPNRGAFVARPSAKETRDVFQARRLLEREVVRLVAALPQRERHKAVASLGTHLIAEHKAVAAKDRSTEIRLSGNFHLKLAELAGNGVFVSMLRDLIAQMSLALAAYATTAQLDCSLREHDPIVEALTAGDSERAITLAMAHLDHIEAALTLVDDEGGADLVAIFSDMLEVA